MMKDADIFHALVTHGKKITGVDICARNTRKVEYVRLRAAIMTAMRREGITFTSIARLLACHHANVIHHTSSHIFRLKTDEEYAYIYSYISAYLTDILNADMSRKRINIDVTNIIDSIRFLTLKTKS